MDIWHIKGGRQLEGACLVQGSKNASLPIISSSIVCPARSELHNVPRLRDVDAALRILRHLGCRAEQSGNDVYIDSTGLDKHEIPRCLMEQMRSSVMFMGALLARCGEARLSLPGGCQLGKRPIDLHLSALRQMGARIEENGSEIYCVADELHGADIDLAFPSVGATENIMLAASRAKGRTVVHGAAREPEICALQDYLCAMGVNAYGAGSDMIVVDGIEPERDLSFHIIPDRIVASTIACAAAACGGSVELRGVDPSHFSTVIHFLNEAGCDIIQSKRLVKIKSTGVLKGIGSIATEPYPGFPTDAQPVLMAAMLKAKGKTLITENIFENRFRQAAELCRLGAHITVSSNIAEITGVARLNGTELMATDLRGGASMIVAGLMAEGETIIKDEGHINRGYECFDACMRSLGAEIFMESQSLLKG